MIDKTGTLSEFIFILISVSTWVLYALIERKHKVISDQLQKLKELIEETRYK